MIIIIGLILAMALISLVIYLEVDEQREPDYWVKRNNIDNQP